MFDLPPPDGMGSILLRIRSVIGGQLIAAPTVPNGHGSSSGGRTHRFAPTVSIADFLLSANPRRDRLPDGPCGTGFVSALAWANPQRVGQSPKAPLFKGSWLPEGQTEGCGTRYVSASVSANSLVPAAPFRHGCAVPPPLKKGRHYWVSGLSAFSHWSSKTCQPAPTGSVVTSRRDRPPDGPRGTGCVPASAWANTQLPAAPFRHGCAVPPPLKKGRLFGAFFAASVSALIYPPP